METKTIKILHLPCLEDLILDKDEKEIFDYIEFPYLKPVLEAA